MTTQEHISAPDVEAPADNAPATEHENLEGYHPQLDSLPVVRDVVEKAFSYRGDVTIVNRKGDAVEGYIFDRQADSADTAKWILRLIIKDSTNRMTIRYDDIVSIQFTGKDPAAGKSFQTWMKKYHEKKAAGEKDIRIDPEPL
ncbi:MAG: hypothetical protein ACYCUV_02725 [Phycisphaerae bacterium]